MANQITIVMYHYVRDLERSRFPRIKGLSLERFCGQLDWLARHHTFITIADVFAALRGEQALPPGAVLLTFDDGYSDHYRYVYPILEDRGIQGCFFPPVLPLRDRVVLDVNKIHFTLAATGDAAGIAAYCIQRIGDLRHEFGLQEPDDYVQRLMVASRLDDAPTMFVKRLLQRGLPQAARSRITDEVFRRFVTTDETAFAEELYLTMGQIRTMQRGGMSFGAHGVTHRWFDDLDVDEQRDELLGSAQLLSELGYEPSRWVLAYPYGGTNRAIAALAAELGYAVGFTTEVRTAQIGRDEPLLLPRLDTIDLPFDASAGAPIANNR
jgi:peptidoglycan/xylan/chitin deacetylase (PgdA/CDA1 family)